MLKERLEQIIENEMGCARWEMTEDNERFLIASSCNEVEAIENIVKEMQDEIENKNEEIKDVEFMEIRNFDGVIEYITGSWENWGYDDEYTTCCECCKVVKTSPDSYAWTPDFLTTEYGHVCYECVNDSPESYIDIFVNQCNRANTVIENTKLEDLGFERITEDYESGWYGRFDSPETILKSLQEEHGDDVEVIFEITSNGQFHTNWTAWIRKENVNA